MSELVLTEGRCVRVMVSDLSVGATEGAIVEAIDMVLLLSLPEEAMLTVLVWVPGAGVKPFKGFVAADSGGGGPAPGGRLLGITRPLMVWRESRSWELEPVMDMERSSPWRSGTTRPCAVVRDELGL